MPKRIDRQKDVEQWNATYQIDHKPKEELELRSEDKRNHENAKRAENDEKRERRIHSRDCNFDHQIVEVDTTSRKQKGR